jgi:hypothetical protein
MVAIKKMISETEQGERRALREVGRTASDDMNCYACACPNFGS